jgi:hypothetical protein
VTCCIEEKIIKNIYRLISILEPAYFFEYAGFFVDKTGGCLKNFLIQENVSDISQNLLSGVLGKFVCLEDDV